MLSEHYYLAIDGIDGTDVEVTREQWIRAERRAGFRPKGEDRGQPATGGFGGGGIRGFIRYTEPTPAYRPISGDLLAGALRAAFGVTTDNGYDLPSCEDQDVPVALIEMLAEHLEEGLHGCDHSVGICECNERAALEELQLWVAGKRHCPECGGEGIIDYREVHHVDADGNDWLDYEHVLCTNCDRGLVPLEP